MLNQCSLPSIWRYALSHTFAIIEKYVPEPELSKYIRTMNLLLWLNYQGHCPRLCASGSGKIRNAPFIWKCKYFIIYSILIRWLWWPAEGIRALTYDPNRCDNIEKLEQTVMSVIKRTLLQIYFTECYRLTYAYFSCMKRYNVHNNYFPT
jgi:hypothetical protein